MSVQSSRLASGAAPLNRALLDSAASPVRVLFGVLFLGWSWISTITILGGFLAPLLPGAVLGIVSDRFLVTFGIAVLISIAEFVCSERWPGVYWLVLLLLDASFTTWQTRAWLLVLIEPHTHITTSVHVVIWLASIVGGIIAARFGEALLFGARR